MQVHKHVHTVTQSLSDGLLVLEQDIRKQSVVWYLVQCDLASLNQMLIVLTYQEL